MSSILPKFSVIYADCPWNYKRGPGGRGAAGKYYSTMTTKKLTELPVQDISTDDSVLCMWATGPCLPDALWVMNAWGFEYVTVLFTWVKRNKVADTWFWGCGHHTRANPEWVLLGRRGKGLERMSKSVHSVIDKRVMSHSQKPDEVRDRIDELWGLRQGVELFARDLPPDPNWSLWGNECETAPELENFGWA